MVDGVPGGWGAPLRHRRARALHGHAPPRLNAALAVLARRHEVPTSQTPLCRTVAFSLSRSALPYWQCTCDNPSARLRAAELTRGARAPALAQAVAAFSSSLEYSAVASYHLPPCYIDTLSLSCHAVPYCWWCSCDNFSTAAAELVRGAPAHALARPVAHPGLLPGYDPPVELAALVRKPMKARHTSSAQLVR